MPEITESDEVTGSNPVSPTSNIPGQGLIPLKIRGPRAGYVQDHKPPIDPVVVGCGAEVQLGKAARMRVSTVFSVTNRPWRWPGHAPQHQAMYGLFSVGRGVPVDQGVRKRLSNLRDDHRINDQPSAVGAKSASDRQRLIPIGRVATTSSPLSFRSRPTNDRKPGSLSTTTTACTMASIVALLEGRTRG